MQRDRIGEMRGIVGRRELVRVCARDEMTEKLIVIKTKIIVCALVVEELKVVSERSVRRLSVLTGAGVLSGRPAARRGAVCSRALSDSAWHLQLLKQWHLCNLRCVGSFRWNRRQHRANHLSLQNILPTEGHGKL